MGLFDDVKSSITGSDSKSESRFDDSKFSSSFQNSQGGQQMNKEGIDDDSRPRENPDRGNVNDSFNDVSAQQGQGQDSLDMGDDRNIGTPRNSGSSRGRNNQRSSHDSPNPRAGRPREGDSQPQLSRQTEKKMENAGFQMDDSQGRGNADSVSSRRDDLEEIKSQNEQIIELLKRVNESLNNSDASRRHGGRR